VVILQFVATGVAYLVCFGSIASEGIATQIMK